MYKYCTNTFFFKKKWFAHFVDAIAKGQNWVRKLRNWDTEEKMNKEIEKLV